METVNAQVSQSQEVMMRLAVATEQRLRNQNFRDQAYKGNIDLFALPQVPQLGYQQPPQLEFQTGYEEQPRTNAQMHRRPQAKQWSKWPESVHDYMRSSQDEQPARQVCYNKSDSGSDSSETKRVLKEVRRKRKAAKQAKREESRRRQVQESRRSHRSRTPDRENLKDRKCRRNNSDSSKSD